LLLVLAVIWIATHLPAGGFIYTASGKPSVLGPLAKGKSRLVNFSVPSKGVPLYMRSEQMRTRAQELAASVVAGKAKIAAHRKAGKLRVCSPTCTLRTTIAGVVRDRKMLKRLQYDQPF
jgi:hypothetical protein